MKIQDHFITKTPESFLRLSETDDGTYFHHASTELPDEGTLQSLPLFTTLETALDDMVSKSDDWFNGTPIFVSHQANRLLMAQANRFLRKHRVLVHEHKTIRDKWSEWFPVRLPQEK